MTDKLAVEGIIAGHFDSNRRRYPKGESVKASYEEIEKIVELMHLQGEYPVLIGQEHQCRMRRHRWIPKAQDSSFSRH